MQAPSSACGTFSPVPGEKELNAQTRINTGSFLEA